MSGIPVFRGGQQSNYQLNKRVVALRKLAPSLALAAPANAVAASLSTALTGNQNDLDFTAKVKGAAGNSIKVAYVDPEDNDQELSVEVEGTTIVVNLATGAEGAITTTAAQIKSAIDGNDAAAALVSVANKSGNDGSGVVTAMTEAALSGGINGTPAEAWEQRYHDGYVYLNASDAPATVATANWKKWAVSAA